MKTGQPANDNSPDEITTDMSCVPFQWYLWIRRQANVG